ncbi:MAG: hypothetical protein AB1782_05460 [Cyanobacteriota bacterium]
MKNIKAVVIIFLVLFTIYSPKTDAILGNTAEQNIDIYGEARFVPKYNYGGPKEVVMYKSDNAVISVVYRNKKSILETITYNNSVDISIAIEDIKKYMLPDSNIEPLFSSSMKFAGGSFKEFIYKNGMKAKILFNRNGEATDVISSIPSESQIFQTNIESEEENEL